MSSKSELLKYFDISYEWNNDDRSLKSVTYRHRFSNYYIMQMAFNDVSFEENLQVAENAFWEWFFEQSCLLMESHQ